jgi:outer membrane lipoprotein-sorting protein
MKRAERTILLLLLLVPCYATQGQNDFREMKDPSVFIKKFRESSGKVSTIESGFTQEKNLNLLSETILSRGSFFFKKENRLRWEYTDPFPYLIIIRGGEILIRDDSRETRFDSRENRIFSEVNAIVLGSVKGTLFTDEKKFSSAFFENPSFYLVQLTPVGRQLKEYLTGIRIFFDKSDLTVAKLEMQEDAGDFTRIIFTGKKINKPIPDEKFAF